MKVDSSLIHSTGLHVCKCTGYQTNTLYIHSKCTLVLVLVIPQTRLSYVDPINGVNQQVAIRPVAPLAADTPALLPQLHGSLSAVEVLMYGLARPLHETHTRTRTHAHAHAHTHTRTHTHTHTHTHAHTHTHTHTPVHGSVHV